MSNSIPVNTLWILISALLVFIMQAGFLCIETGLTRSKNNINVAVKNLADFFTATLAFFIVGYGLMFGSSQLGLLGSDNFAPQLNSIGEHAFFLFQIMFAATSITITSGAIAERVRFKAYFLIAVFVSLFIYPIYGHWVWAGTNLGDSVGWLGQLGFVDFAGASVVHSTGGWVSLALLLVIGPRAGRFNQDGSANTIEGSNLPLAALGVLLLVFGWFGFNGGSRYALDNQVFYIIINTLLGASGGLIFVVIHASLFKPTLSAYNAMNGILVGLVSVTASANSINHLSAIIIGMVGGLTMLGLDHLLTKLQIDDAVGAIPVHLGGGVWGTFAVGLFGSSIILDTGLPIFNQIMVQLLGIGAGALWAFFPTYIIFSLINKINPLRVTPQCEQVGLNISEHGASTELVSFLTILDEQTQSGDTSLRAPVEPFTEVGQIAERYNGVMDRLELRDGQLGEILSNSPLALFSTDIYGIITQTEGSFFQQLGIDVTQSIYKLVEKDSEIKQKVLEIFEGEHGEWVVEIEGKYVYFRCHPAYDDANKIIGLTGIATDITPQRIATIEREKYIDMLSTSAAISEQITTILDIKELIETILPMLINKYDLYHAAVLMLDQSSDSLRFEFGSDAHSKKMREMRAMIPLNHPHSLIARAARQKEVVVANDVSAEPMYLPHPLMTGTKSELAIPLMVDNDLIGILDIQEKSVDRFGKSDIDLFVSISRQIAIAIRNANSFEKAKKTEARMKAALQRSLDADKAKDEFLARVSHELRTPLGVILGYAEMLQDEIYGETSDEQNDRLEDIISSSNHLTELVNQLLDSAKLNSGKIEPTYKPIDLPNLIEQVNNQMSVLAQQKGLSFQTNLDKSIPEIIESDPTVIRQMLINLIGNAIKFTDKGLVSLEVLPKGMSQVAFIVKDTGIGIPQKFQKTVFEPFQQVDGSRTRTHEGTGLGLAITKRMAEILGGSINLTSIEGRGSQFTIILPLSPATKAKKPNIKPIKQRPLPEFEQGSELEPIAFPLSKERLS